MARQIYELETGYTVKQVGVVLLGEYVCCSPDGLIDDDGLIEIKCMGDKRFYEFVSTGKIDTDYYNQIQMQLYVTRRKWCSLFVFNPNFTPNYIMVRVLPDMEAIMQIKAGLARGEASLLAELEKVKSKLEPNIQSEVSESLILKS